MSPEEELALVKKALAREKKARITAEKTLADTTRELHESSKKIARLLNQKSLELEAIAENIADAYLVMDMEGRILKFNKEASKLFNYDTKNGTVNAGDVVYREDAEYAKTAFESLKKKGFIRDYTSRFYTKGGVIKWVHANASVIKDNENKSVAIQAIVRDLTSQYEYAEKLMESNNRLAMLISNLDDALLLEDEKGEVVLTNEKFCHTFKINQTPGELVGLKSDRLVNSIELVTDPEEFKKRTQTILDNKNTVLSEIVKLRDGRVLERDFIPIKVDDTPKGHLWSYKDVTLKHNYHKSIEAQRLKYGNIITNMNLGLIEVNNSDEILMANPSFELMTGYSEKELLGKKASEVFHADKKVMQNEAKKRLEGQVNSYEVEVTVKNGEKRHWLISGGPNYDISGNIIGSIGVHLDITRIKTLEIQKERLLYKLEKSNEELQEYAHIVSHDLKSPLRSIDALVSWLKEDNKENLDEVSLQNFSLVESTLEKMEQLISDILNYSTASNEKPKKSYVDIDELVKELLKMLYVPEHIEIEISGKLPKMRVDRVKIQQVFQNLISNAVKFIDKPKGHVYITAEDAGGHYKFAITDNGIGIEPQYHKQIFKLFHSLKKSKESTGIGLSIVKKIIKNHSGNIWLESACGKGSTFYFTLKK